MHDFGLSPEHEARLLQILSCFPEVADAIVFGSRAMGNYKAGSDIDLALKASTTIPLARMMQLNSAIEGTNIPYKVDLIDFNSIDNDELRSHIIMHGHSLFRSK